MAETDDQIARQILLSRALYAPRLLELLKLCKRLIAESGNDFWYWNIFASLLMALDKAFRQSTIGIDFKDLSIAALAARSGLELKMWTLFAMSSKENARRIHNDQMIDAAEMVTSFSRSSQLVGEYRSLVDQSVGEMREALKTRSDDFDDYGDSGYLRTRRLASSVGCEEEFATLYPILSKMVHPTALSILVPNDGQPLIQTFHFAQTTLHYCRFSAESINNFLAKSDKPHLAEAPLY